MRIVFFGSPSPALPTLERLLDAGHSVELVITQPDRPAGRGRRLTPSAVKKFALARNIPTLEPERIRKDDSVLARIREARPDVHVVVAYGQIIPGPVIDFPEFHSLNVHFSLLPKYRGAAPVQWTILRGDSESGVTIIELNERMDEGDILASVRTPVGPRETAAGLEARLALAGAELLIQTLDRIDRVERRPQDGSQASLAPKIRKEDGRIDWSKDAEDIDRRVRALAERPGTFTFFRGKRLQIHGGMPLDARSLGRRPGEIIAAAREGLQVACGGGTIFLVQDLQPEGRNRMTAYTFSLGGRVEPAEELGNG
jgi:methionyl-tRNA formyltransferase